MTNRPNDLIPHMDMMILLPFWDSTLLDEVPLVDILHSHTTLN